MDGVTTNYTLDLNTGLTQVLADGTNTYLYGNGRISQAGSITEYFLADALGSVRQLTDPAGAVMLTQSYAPYGDTISSAGSGVSVYQFTGEMRDANGLTYLRARYLDSGTGRFINRDTWGGDYNRPLSLNRWGYVEGNPINLTDPSGHNPWWCIYAPNPTECVNKWYDNSDRIWVDHLNNLYANIDRVWENKCSEPDTISTPIIILGCGAGNNPCGSSEYGLFEYKSWAASEGFVVYAEGFPGWYGGVKNEVAKNMVNDIAENPGKTVVFIGHSAGADSVIIAMSQLSAEVKVAAIVLMDPTLINGDNTLTLPSGNNVKLYDTAFDGVSILPFDQQLDGNLRKRWPNEQDLHQALAKDGVVKDDTIAFIEARLAQ